MAKGSLTLFRFSHRRSNITKKKGRWVRASWKIWLRISEVTGGGYMFRYPEHYSWHGPSPMRPRTIGPKLLIIAATALAITIAGSAEAEHDHGGEGWDGGDRHEGRGWHGGEDRHEGWGRHGREDWHAGWGWHGGGGWNGPAGWHDNGRHLGWYKHGWGGPGWRGPFALAYGWRLQAFRADGADGLISRKRGRPVRQR